MLAVLVFLAVILTAGTVAAWAYVSSPSYSCGSNQMVLQSHTTTTGQLVTTWFNCGDYALSFYVSGNVMSAPNGQTNPIQTEDTITVGSHQSASAISHFDTTNLNVYSLVEIYALSRTSASQVLSPVYDFRTATGNGFP
jgi:hypothetical protein